MLKAEERSTKIKCPCLAKAQDLTNTFRYKRGVRQGCVLSPRIFTSSNKLDKLLPRVSKHRQYLYDSFEVHVFSSVCCRGKFNCLKHSEVNRKR